MVDKPWNNHGVWNSKDLGPIPCLRVAVGDRCVVGPWVICMVDTWVGVKDAGIVMGQVPFDEKSQ